MLVAGQLAHIVAIQLIQGRLTWRCALAVHINRIQHPVDGQGTIGLDRLSEGNMARMCRLTAAIAVLGQPTGLQLADAGRLVRDGPLAGGTTVRDACRGHRGTAHTCAGLTRVCPTSITRTANSTTLTGLHF